MFKTLGWDIDNEKGYAEAYKDVIHEYSQKTKDTVKAPDYYFRIGGTGKFFVEAKKPSVNIEYDIHPAFQLRRYGWSAKLPLSILTDFEEFAVYDCRVPPRKNDKASTARIMFITYDKFIERWDELEEIFSREAVLKGSFDKFAESTKKKRGTAEVDEAFLKAMEAWRMMLAKNIALRNSKLSIRELNFAVQKTIDRIIFLRICEDRGIEDYGELMNLLNGSNIYGRLKIIFTQADEKYNSGLFHFELEKGREEPPDELTPNISIDDKILKEIIKNLYYPESPYEFSVLPADILGQVYEQFLGKVIRLTPAHHAVIEDKPEVKKAGGVYYTPTYIVDYIVKNTVGKILEKKTPKQIAKIRILDPACGSGSFLLGAYQNLLDWHLNYYSKHINEKGIKPGSKKSPVYEAANGDIKLTTAQRKRILLNNLYGVDIDTQAVEVTKLSLLLKVLEGESGESLSNQMRMFRDRALPDLANNIKCGNSLISPDFYDQTEMNFLDEEEKLRINVFDWNTEFKEIMLNGGFDVVIGNPPYYGRASGFSKEEKEYIQKSFVSSEGKYETYQLFIEKALSLLKHQGLHSFITPQTWLSIVQSKKLREFIKKNFSFDSILYSQKTIFNVSVDNIVYSIKKSIYKKGLNIFLYTHDFIADVASPFNSIPQKDLYKGEELVIDVFGDEKVNSIESKIRLQSIPLSSICYAKDGVKVVGPAKDFAFSKEKIDETFFPMVAGKDIVKYNLVWGGYYCCRDKRKIERQNATDIRLREEFIFNRKKIVLRKTGSSIVSAIDIDNFYYEQSLFSISLKELDSNHKLELILGIINSKLANYLLKANPFSKKKTFPQIRLHWLKEFPIPSIQSLEENYKIVTKIISNVNSIQKAVKDLKKVKTPAERTAQLRQIKAADKQIDQLVYKLYGLTDKEIKIVEGRDG